VLLAAGASLRVALKLASVNAFLQQAKAKARVLSLSRS
jgi:hypothetical protein